MASVRLIHIAPELPPTVGGVADYTALLSRRLVEVSDGAVEPVLVHAGKEPADAIDVELPVVDLSGQCSAPAFSETVGRLADEVDGQAKVLLEYSGYGYSKRGAPLWLVRGLRRVCGGGALPLVTMFHELYATSWKPWTKAFWTMPIQWITAVHIVRLSRGLASNRDHAVQWIDRRRGDCPVRNSPTFSNVGEPEEAPKYDKRAPYAVLFGGRRMKNHMYEEGRSIMRDMLTQVGVRRIIEIGPRASCSSQKLGSIPIERRGILSATEVSNLLKRASLGILKHPLHCLTKSGVWASYAAHGVAPVIMAEPRSLEKLEEGTHYLLLDDSSDFKAWNGGQLASVGRCAREWYIRNAHSKRAAQKLFGLLRST